MTTGGDKFQSLALRIRKRREELRLTRPQLCQMALESHGTTVSSGALKNLENEKKPYRLPRHRATGGRKMTILEGIAAALDVPLGYLLAAYDSEDIEKSCYGPAVRAGQIKLINDLRQASPTSTLRQFVEGLPSSEEDLFRLPLYSYVNEFAFCVIFKIETLFPGLEMLLVNEPPLILWDDDDVDMWTESMNLGGDDRSTFRSMFFQYRSHFRTLLGRREKFYKVVLNYPTYRRFLAKKGSLSRKVWIDDVTTLLTNTNFNLAIFNVENQDQDMSEVHESEVLCKSSVVPMNLYGTVSIQILQTPPHINPTSYFVSPAPRDAALIQRDIGRIDSAWAQALDQYRSQLNIDASRRGLLTDGEISAHTQLLLST